MKKRLASTLAALATVFMFNGTIQAAENTTPDSAPTYSIDVHQPMVQLENKAAQKKINSYMLDFARQLPKDIDDYMKYDAVCAAQLNSQVTYKNDKLISIVTDQYVNMENSAHPGAYRFGRIFSTTDGHSITLEELATLPEFKSRASHYNMDYIRAAIYNKYSKYLYADREYLANLQLPQDVYMDQDGNVHIIIQTYEIAPYATGIIDVNLDVTESPLN